MPVHKPIEKKKSINEIKDPAIRMPYIESLEPSNDIGSITKSNVIETPKDKTPGLPSMPSLKPDWQL